MATLQNLYLDNASSLHLQLVEGKQGLKKRLDDHAIASADMVGHLNLIHGDRIQVLGRPEIDYLQKLKSSQREQLVNDLWAAGMPAVIVAESLDIPDAFRARCRGLETPLFSSPLPAAKVIDGLRVYLTKLLAQHTELHGVLMDVLGMGVLITGESGLGKSELALELISRGHGLVADDVVEVHQISPNMIEGRCPQMLQNLLEVRGLGLLDIKAIFGETAVRRRMRLKLIVHLVRRSTLDSSERLPIEQQFEDILSVKVRKVVLPVAAGRNLAVLLEAAVRNTILQLRGIDTLGEFMQRQSALMAQQQDS